MDFDLFRPCFSLLEGQGTRQQQATSRAPCGLPLLDCAMGTLTSPCCLCLHWEPAARWCCRGESGGGRGERLQKSRCRCRCQPRRPGGNHLLPGHWVLSHPGHHWSPHRSPYRTICHCRCDLHWKLCWIVCYYWSDQSKGHPTA